MKTSSKNSWTQKRRAFVAYLKRAGIPTGRSERLAAKFARLAQPEAVGKVVAIEKGGKVYSVTTPPGGVGGGGGTVFVFKGASGIEIRGRADKHAVRKSRRKRAGLPRSRK
jgi:hypothetical protein